MIIDFHTHTFPEKISGRALEKLSAMSHMRYYEGGSEQALLSSMRKAGIDRAVTLPVVTGAGQTGSINDGVIRRLEELTAAGIIPFGGLHPDSEGVKETVKRLRAAGVRGIKLHPAFQGVDFSDVRYKRIVAAASEEDMIVVIHAGDDISFMEHNYASVPMILEVLREVQPPKLVLAHMGGWMNWQQVRSELAGAPVWLDTAFSIGCIQPRAGEEALLEFHEQLPDSAFTELVRAHGADRVLFGTDSPWADQKDYLDLIRAGSLTAEEQALVLGGNAAALLGL